MVDGLETTRFAYLASGNLLTKDGAGELKALEFEINFFVALSPVIWCLN
jgi:hypothetical protein